MILRRLPARAALLLGVALALATNFAPALATAQTRGAAPAVRAPAAPSAHATPAARPARTGQPAGKRVIVLVAMPGAGKTTAAQLLSDKTGAPRWTSGDVIRNTIKQRGLPYTPENDKAVSEEFAKQPGQIGKRIAAEVKASPGDIAIVEGFRTVADLDAFKNEIPGTTVVAIEVSASRRHTRMLARGRAGEDNLPFLRDRDHREIRRGVRDVMSKADIRLRPRGETLGDLDRSLDRIRNLLVPTK